MNPNVAQSLDPKLKETYDRIMGMELPKTANQPATQAPAPQPQAHVPVEGVAMPSEPAIEPTPAPVVPVASAEPGMVSINTEAPQAKPAKSPRKLSPIIFVAVGVGFFLIYTFVWLKFFGIF